MPEEFEKWIDAGYFSSEATSLEKAGGWKDLTYPLAATRKQEVLDSIWKAINMVRPLLGICSKVLITLVGVHSGFGH